MPIHAIVNMAARRCWTDLVNTEIMIHVSSAFCEFTAGEQGVYKNPACWLAPSTDEAPWHPPYALRPNGQDDVATTPLL